MQQPQIISAERAAFLVGLTPRHLSRLVKEGWIKKTADDKYTDAGTSQGYVAFLKDEARRGSKTSAQTELQTERAKMLQLKREQLAGTLMLVEDHVAVAEEATGAMRTEMAMLPAQISTDVNERARIEGLCDTILANFAARLNKRAVDIEADSEAGDSVS